MRRRHIRILLVLGNVYGTAVIAIEDVGFWTRYTFENPLETSGKRANENLYEGNNEENQISTQDKSRSGSCTRKVQTRQSQPKVPVVSVPRHLGSTSTAGGLLTGMASWSWIWTGSEGVPASEACRR